MEDETPAKAEEASTAAADDDSSQAKVGPAVYAMGAASLLLSFLLYVT